ncbi:MAG: ATP--guanido phosphotransferase [Defluviitaleaceae bacterium]|nr:ATP--guanido phosphotransferase [Defluviitaleaceae bacterium]
MEKWYEQDLADEGVIISSRVRLARNLANYPFPTRLAMTEAAICVRSMRASVFSEQNRDYIENEGLKFSDLTHLSNWDLNSMAERHVISPAMAQKDTVRGLISSESENLSVMFNEEDHIRIQSIFVGQDLDAAYTTAATLDDMMAENLDYAFDKDFGYLTSCPTNTGTGLRASYMLHIPILESSGALKAFGDVITKMGCVMRGAHGEGTSSMGGIYQISNQKTLGKTEDEIIDSLKQLTNQLVEKEKSLQEQMTKEFLAEAIDSVWRSWAILAHCRKINLGEAIRHLSEIRLGHNVGIHTPRPQNSNIYSLMSKIQPFSLQKIMGTATDARHLDMLRADFLREEFAR